jgi:hypothetical protein
MRDEPPRPTLVTARQALFNEGEYRCLALRVEVPWELAERDPELRRVLQPEASQAPPP